MTKEQPETPKRSGYIDQWRGISVLMVILSHLILYKFSPYLQPLHSGAFGKVVSVAETWGFGAGRVGVCIFFVISGYLITQLMIREDIRSATISLPAFYIRRVCRILPALLSLVIVVALLGIAGLTPTNEPHDTEVALSFLCNTSSVECPRQFPHLWSLALEEQFYLIWPLLMILAAKYRKHFVVATIIIAACATLIPSLMVRGWLNNGLAVYCLSSGVLFALSARFRRLFETVTGAPTWVLVSILAGLLPFAVVRWHILEPVGLIVLPPLVVATVLGRNGPVSAVARVSAILEQIGVVSYSLYLWHWIGSWDANQYSSAAFYWASFAALPFAWMSYRYIEQPFIRAGHRWSTAVRNFRAARRTQLEH
jgi:peptidoglycan/LPS O-acetylase OafA/YrhL